MASGRFEPVGGWCHFILYPAEPEGPYTSIVFMAPAKI